MKTGDQFVFVSRKSLSELGRKDGFVLTKKDTGLSRKFVIVRYDDFKALTGSIERQR